MTMIRRRFYAGDYAGVLKLLARRTRSHKNASIEVGALVFTGDLREAEGVFRKAFPDAGRRRKGPSRHRSKTALTHEEAEARFFLGIGLVRSSENARGASLFGLNLSRARLNMRSKSGAIPRFYALQGAAFYRFFQGRYRTSAAHAEKALIAASEADFHYGRILALDLLAHSLCQLGQISRGLRQFDKAEEIARRVGNGGIVDAIRISKLRFRCQYGILLDSAEHELDRALQTLEPTDTYSQVELKLELARQLVLRGRNHRARRLLDQFGEEVHRHRNLRQTSVYQHRVAHSLYLMGEPSAALTLARSARGLLDPRMDRVYLAQLQGLEDKIRGITHSVQDSGLDCIDSRIRSRAWAPQVDSEDIIGNWMDRAVHEREGAVLGLVKAGLNGLIPRALGLETSDSVFILGPVKGMVILSCEGDVRVIHEGWSPSLTRLIQALASSTFRSKEELIRAAWGYDAYHPERHDGLLHGSLARIRKLLGEFSAWVEVSESGYRLQPLVRIVDSHLNASKPSQEESARPERLQPQPVAPTLRQADSIWNVRQFQALQLMKQGVFLGVTEYSQKFRVSKITASRDLGSLHVAGAVRKFGRARATHYGLV